MSGNSWGRWTAVSFIGALACGLAMLAGSRLNLDHAHTGLTFPRVGASSLQFRSEQAAKSVLLPVYFRTIPLRMFGGDMTGLKIGVTLAVQTESGKQLVGTVVAISETTLTMRVDSWKHAAPSSH